MYKNKKIAVVIPAYNEEVLIKSTVLTLPSFIDKIIVINDASLDKTKAVLDKIKIKKLKVISHKENKGVGSAITTGYKYSLKNNIDYTVVIGADGQMEPKELKPMLDFIIKKDLDYVKGNRFLKPWTLKDMPITRLLGSLALNLMTKVATGYYFIGDPQSGYTIISLSTLKKLKLDDIYPRYGYPNDMLGKLSKINAKVKDFPISAIYKDEESGLKPLKIIIPYTKLLLKIYKERKGLWLLRKNQIFLF